MVRLVPVWRQEPESDLLASDTAAFEYRNDGYIELVLKVMARMCDGQNKLLQVSSHAHARTYTHTRSLSFPLSPGDTVSWMTSWARGVSRYATLHVSNSQYKLSNNATQQCQNTVRCIYPCF